MNKWIIPLSGLVLSTLLSCNSEQRKKRRQAIQSYPVYTLQQVDTTVKIEYVADVQAFRNVELHSRTPGLISRVLVEEGQFVKKGQLLFKIDDTEARIAFNKAEAALHNAQAGCRLTQLELERTQKLVDKQVISPTELKMLKVKLDAQNATAYEARANLAAAKAILSYTSIVAPFDGVIDRFALREGSLVDNGTFITTISDIKKMYAYFSIPENEYFRLSKAVDIDHPFGEASLVLADGSSYALKGKITAAESEIDESTGSIAFKATFLNPDNLLKHGASAKLTINNPAKNIIMVPQKSVFEIQDKSYVYVVDDKNEVQMKNFIPAQLIGNYYMVASGLRPNEKIVYEGIQRLKNGEKIKPEAATL